ncbi:MAG: aldose epimerase family protein [Rikenellaceae bacterium]
MDIEQYVYGMSEEGEVVVVYLMRADNGAEIQLTNLGASVISVKMPNAKGELEDILLGYSDFANMLRDTAYMGRTIGRTVGRIASGEVTIGGEEHLLDLNAGAFHVHGGASGYHKRMWESRVETNRVVMSLVGDDGESGYPGTLTAEVIFDFDDEMNFEISYLAKSDKTTIVNLAPHLYFNLSGDMKSTMLDHELQINASKVCEVDCYGAHTGELLAVEATPLDFTSPKAIGADIKGDFNEMRYSRGYDHLFAIDSYEPQKLTHHATLSHAGSGRRVEVYSSQQGLGLYSGNHIAVGSPTGTKSGEKFVQYGGVVLMPQALSGVEITPEEVYCQKNSYKFSTF